MQSKSKLLLVNKVQSNPLDVKKTMAVSKKTVVPVVKKRITEKTIITSKPFVLQTTSIPVTSFVPEVKIPEVTIPEVKIPEVIIPEVIIPEITIPEVTTSEVKQEAPKFIPLSFDLPKFQVQPTEPPKDEGETETPKFIKLPSILPEIQLKPTEPPVESEIIETYSFFSTPCITKTFSSVVSTPVYIITEKMR